MSEARKTSACLKTFRERYPAAYVVKVNDRTTGGRPDAEITLHGKTIWVEFKVCGPNDDPVKACTPLQRHTLRRILNAGGEAYVGVFVLGGNERLYSVHCSPDPQQIIELHCQYEGSKGSLAADHLDWVFRKAYGLDR
jgi:hypothetical protein